MLQVPIIFDQSGHALMTAPARHKWQEAQWAKISKALRARSTTQILSYRRSGGMSRSLPVLLSSQSRTGAGRREGRDQQAWIWPWVRGGKQPIAEGEPIDYCASCGEYGRLDM
jgi:hypothetical protein